MRSLTSTAIVAIVAGTIGFATLTPAAFAQQGPTPGQQPGGNQMQMHGQMQMPGHFGNHRFERRNNRNTNGVRPGALLDLVCGDGAAERAELGFVRLSYRLDLTPEQKTLFDDLKTSTLTAQTQFADQCATSAPAAPAAPDATAAAATPPTPVERLTNQLSNDSARLELMQGLLPKLEAFYNSLTDEQKAAMTPERDADNGNGFNNRRGRMHMPGMPGQPAEPGQPGEMPAPDATPAPPTAG